MKQVIQNLSNGQTSLVDVPCPKCHNDSLLIASRNSLISVGTERMLVDFGKANIFDKVRQQPDKVNMVLNKAKTDGILSTIDAVRSKLDQPIPLGYCNAGIVLESGVVGYEPGDRVVSNGNHAEVVSVPKNLCSKIPDGVDDESAAFTVLAAVGLQGIRLINPTLGETVVVFGLGLIGLMTVQMLLANGCRVIGIDSDSSRCELANQFGAKTVDLSKNDDPIEISRAFSRGRGVDAVLITAASKSNEIIHQSAEMCRKRGRVVLVGVVGLNLIRDDFFKKEITFQVSASYGPGRYDPLYEEKGQDYPVGFVRWTEQRNFEAVLDMMDSGVLDVKPLITHRYKIEEALSAYELLNDAGTLGILIQYPPKNEVKLRTPIVELIPSVSSKYMSSNAIIGFVGAGNYASRILIPVFKKTGSILDTLVTSGGLSSSHYGKKMGFRMATTDLEQIWHNNLINAVVIATRHDSHSNQVISALNSGKHVFVEKPLALTLKELSQIDSVFQSVNKENNNPLRLMVGFNRRFAPHILKMKSLLDNINNPKIIIMTINAGEIPADHWTQDSEVGGGRIIGEGCHFIDLMRHLVGHKIINYTASTIGSGPGVDIREDKVSITLSFLDGSLGTIHYLSNGGPSFPKERIEVFCDNSVLQMDNYRVLKGYNWPGFKKLKLFKQDKGQKACASSFVDAIAHGTESPIPYNEIIESSRISIEISNILKK